MSLIDELLSTLPDGNVLDVRIGLHWTAVVVGVDGIRRCGLASTLTADHEHGEVDVPHAGRLELFSALELAQFARSDQPTKASIGVAALNALVPTQPESWVDANASEVIAHHGAGKVVALIGRFPFIPALRSQAEKLFVLERNPGEGDLPEEAASEILPRADVVAITGMTLINHTLDTLLQLCAPGALVLVLGPSTPLSTVLFEHGVDIISGSVVTNITPVLRAIGQGANFKQVHLAGVRLVTAYRPGFAWKAEPACKQ
jgi:uncharacterized protein (DUF4213/DUF364 family)